MNYSRIISVFYILFFFSCVDPIVYKIDLPQSLPISISGYITNLPGPYKVYLNSSFDITSEVNLKTPVSAKHVNLLDEIGNNEELLEVEKGVYQTRSTQGRIGGVYKILIELIDGRIYESIADTLLAPGEIDSLYYGFSSIQDNLGATSDGLDVLINTQGNKQNDGRYMWKMKGTFKAVTHPEWIVPQFSECYPIPEQGNKCNYLPLCTGVQNTAPRNRIPAEPDFKKIASCSCCTCWYQMFSNAPILSDDLFTSKATYQGKSIYRIPVNEWFFMFKLYVQASQFTLTKNSFRFFKSIQDQREAVGSLFQPITGKTPNNFVQLSGTLFPINGIFYAGGVSIRSNYITSDDISHSLAVPKVGYKLDFEVDFTKKDVGRISCLELFPNATNIKPDFWVD